MSGKENSSSRQVNGAVSSKLSRGNVPEGGPLYGLEAIKQGRKASAGDPNEVARLTEELRLAHAQLTVHEEWREKHQAEIQAAKEDHKYFVREKNAAIKEKAAMEKEVKELRRRLDYFENKNPEPSPGPTTPSSPLLSFSKTMFKSTKAEDLKKQLQEIKDDRDRLEKLVQDLSHEKALQAAELERRVLELDEKEAALRALGDQHEALKMHHSILEAGEKRTAIYVEELERKVRILQAGEGTPGRPSIADEAMAVQSVMDEEIKALRDHLANVQAELAESKAELAKLGQNAPGSLHDAGLVVGQGHATSAALFKAVADKNAEAFKVRTLEAKLRQWEEKTQEMVEQLLKEARMAASSKERESEERRQRAEEEALAAQSQLASVKQLGAMTHETSAQLQEDNKRYRARIKEMAAQLEGMEKLTHENEKQRASLLELEARMREEAEEAAAELEQVKEQLSTLLDAEMERRAKVEEDALLRVTELEQLLERSKGKAAALETELQSVQGRLAEVIRGAENNRIAWKAEREGLRAEIAALEQKCKELQSEVALAKADAEEELQALQDTLDESRVEHAAALEAAELRLQDAVAATEARVRNEGDQQLAQLREELTARIREQELHATQLSNSLTLSNATWQKEVEAKDKQLFELSEALAGAEASVEALEKKVADASSDLAALEREVKEKEAAVGELARRLEATKAANEEAARCYETALEEKSKVISGLNEEVSEGVRARGELQVQALTLESSLKAMQARLEQEASAAATAKSQMVKAWEEERAGMAARIEELASSSASVRSLSSVELQREASRAEKLSARVGELEAEVAKAKDERKAVEATLSGLALKHAESCAAVETLQASLDALRGKTAGEADALDKAKQELVSARRQVSTLLVDIGETVESLNLEVSKLVAAASRGLNQSQAGLPEELLQAIGAWRKGVPYDSATTAVAALTRWTGDMGSAIASVRRHMAGLTAELGDSSEYAAQLQELRGERASLTKEVGRLDTEVTRLTGLLSHTAAVEAELASANGRLVTFKAELTAKDRQLKESEEMVAAAESRCRELEKKRAALEQQLAELNKQVAGLEVAQAEAKALLHAEREVAAARLQEEKDRLEDAKARCASLSAQLASEREANAIEVAELEMKVLQKSEEARSLAEALEPLKRAGGHTSTSRSLEEGGGALVAGLREKLAALKDELERTRQDAAQADKAAVEERRNREKAEEQLRASSDAVRREVLHAESASAALMELKKELASKDKALAEAEEAVKKKGKGVPDKQVKKELEDLRVRVKAAEEGVLAKSQLVEFLNRQLASKEGEVADAQRGREEAEARLSSSESVLIAQLQTCGALKDRIHVLHEEVAVSHQAFIEAKEEVEEAVVGIPKALSDNHEVAAAVSQTVQRLRSDLNEVKSLGAFVAAEVATAMNHMAQDVREIQKLREDKGKLQARVKFLESELAEVVDRLY
eukprot:jgi/Mesvir1/5400/Mv15473-RA.1